MGNFRVFLDGNEYTNIGDIDQIEVEFERGEKEKGFFVKYAQKIRLYKDAYAYVLGLFEENGGCGDVEVLVEYKCSDSGDYSTLVEGNILLNDIEFNEKVCVAIADIEDNGITQLFLDMMKTKVNLETTVTLNGTGIVSPTIKRVLRNFFEEDGTLLTETNGVDYARGYTFQNAFDKILNYITDGRLRLASDFFSTLPTDKAWAVGFVAAPAIGNTVTFEFLNELGETKTFNVTRTTTLAAWADAVVANLANYNYTTTYLVAGANISFAIKSYAVKDTLVNVTTTGTSVITFGTSSQYVSGAKNIYITDGFRLTNSDEKPFKISFEELFEIADNLFDLSYTIEKSGSQYYLRIEPLEYFFDNGISLELKNVPEIIIKPLTDRIKSSVRIGYGVGFNFVNLTCGGQIDRSLEDIAYVLQEDINDQIKGIKGQDEDFYVVEGKGLGGSYDEPKDYLRFQVGAFPLYNTKHFMNALVMGGHLLIKYHTFFLPDKVHALSPSSAQLGTAKQYVKTASFEFPLSFTEFQAISGYSLISFNKYESAETERTGYIHSLKYSVERGMANFELLVK